MANRLLRFETRLSQRQIVLILTLFASTALSGCSHPTLEVTSPNNGANNHPVPEAGEPVVSGVNPSTVVAGGPSFTIAVTGTNFAPGDTVEWNFVPLQSTFISSTQMTAIVPNLQIYEPGSASVIVQAPIPYPFSFGPTIPVTAPSSPGSASFTTSAAAVQANDMVWDPVSQQIYLSVASANPTNPNTVTALNPVTGQLGASVNAGKGADHLAVSSDGLWLYAGIPQSALVQRFAVPSLAADIAIPLGSVSSQPYYAVDLEAAPGSPNTIAVSQVTSPGTVSNEAIVLYDGTTARSSTVTGIFGDLGSLAWNANGSSLYAAFGNNVNADTIYVLSASSTGVKLSQTENLNSGDEAVSMGNIHFSALTGYIYCEDGAVVDPSTGAAVNRLPITALGNGFANPTPPMALDDTLGIAWVVGQLVSNSQYAIEAFDLHTNALVGSIAIPGVTGNPARLVRWGTNGLAFLTKGSGSTQGGVYIVSGNFVTNPSVQ